MVGTQGPEGGGRWGGSGNLGSRISGVRSPGDCAACLDNLAPRFELLYRGTPLVKRRIPLGSYRRPMPRIKGGSQGGQRGAGVFNGRGAHVNMTDPSCYTILERTLRKQNGNASIFSF